MGRARATVLMLLRADIGKLIEIWLPDAIKDSRPNTVRPADCMLAEAGHEGRQFPEDSRLGLLCGSFLVRQRAALSAALLH
jgi:hypothetical protein